MEQTKIIKVDKLLTESNNNEEEVANLLIEDWTIVDKTEINERYIIYTLKFSDTLNISL